MAPEDERSLDRSDPKKTLSQSIFDGLKRHWPETVAISAGIITASVIVIIRHIREKKPELASDLAELEQEASSNQLEPVTLFETAVELNRRTRGEAVALADQALQDAPEHDPLAQGLEVIRSAVPREHPKLPQ